MTLVITIIVLALVFDYINGFHDAANSIATVVSTRVLSPTTAVIWAAFFNFVAYYLFELHVADQVAKTVRPEGITLVVVFSGLIAAIIWNLFTWWKGIPSSSSHTLIGGFAGAAIAHAGGDFDVLKMDKITPILYFILLAPLIGMVLSFIISIITIRICKHTNPSKVDKVFRSLQLLSSAAFSIGHGGNDAQKVVGIIAAALVAASADPTVFSQLPDFMKMTDLHHIPSWIPIACYISISVGTMTGGWRIVKTMGQKVTKLSPFEGFSAETAGALTLFATANWGNMVSGIGSWFGMNIDPTKVSAIPVSTTHTITGSIIGAGMIKRVSSVRWGVTINLIWAWVLTIPISGIVGALAYYIASALHL
ncbi:MAG: inorganic phosphate transporter [Saprospiraceae bacterium]